MNLINPSSSPPPLSLSLSHSFMVACLLTPPGNQTILLYFAQVSLTTSLAEAGHGSRVVGMEYVSDLESICLALSSGDIITCNTITHEVDEMLSLYIGGCFIDDLLLLLLPSSLPPSLPPPSSLLPPPSSHLPPPSLAPSSLPPSPGGGDG